MMVLTKKNKAFSLICVMLFALTHNILPHTHHNHSIVSSEKSDFKSPHHHHHDDSGHHHQSESHDKSFFDLLVESHTHYNHSHESTFTAVRQFKSEKKTDNKIYVNLDFSVYNPLDGVNGKQKKSVCYNIALEDQLFSTFLALRGPPVLG